MGVINVLDFSVANLIAAGEVVERPASVVKELLENAIDAGATGVTVEIKNGGVSLIRVTDNGCGMSKEDVPVAIRRHATSKIHDKTDLNAIATLGFRGEALAAIASVSRLRILTKKKGEAIGTMLISRGGDVESITEAGAPEGTTVIVEELFANVPARRKFLKRDVTEAMAVTSVCEKIALSDPSLSLTLIIDGEIKFSTAGDGKLQNAVYAVFGRQFAKNMTRVESEADGVRVSGFVGTPLNVRPNRNMQIFYVNGRCVKSAMLSAATERALESFTPKEKFPVCVLNIELHPGYVDVNVHPAKLEIKFSNEKPVFDAVYYAVRAAAMGGTSRPQIEPSEFMKKTAQTAPAPTVPVKPAMKSFLPLEDEYEKPEPEEKRQISLADEIKRSFGEPETATATGASQLRSGSYEELSAARKETVSVEPAKKTEAEQSAKDRLTADIAKRLSDFAPSAPEEIPDLYKKEKAADRADDQADMVTVPHTATAPDPLDTPHTYAPGEYRFAGEIFGTYLFVEAGELVYIIDKHAAHERIIFEELKRNIGGKTAYSQITMTPLTVFVTDEEAAAAEEYRREITDTGFDYTVRGTEIAVSEFPSNMTEDVARDLFLTILSELSAGSGNPALSKYSVYEKALYQSACKAAIKAGDQNGEEALTALVDRLMQCGDITYCPHGRPVAFVMTRAAMERRFKRT